VVEATGEKVKNRGAVWRCGPATRLPQSICCMCGGGPKGCFVLGFRSSAFRFAATAVLGFALAASLSACGRKGPLDPPPAALGGPQPSSLDVDAEGRSIAPIGEKKRIPIDWLLD
jgi:predicted small lipoprotein YifL